MASIKQNTDQSLGIAGMGGGAGEFVTLAFQYDANSVDKAYFTASRNYVVKSVIGRPTVAGSDGGAVTAGVNISADATSIPAGNKCHTSTINLKGTAHTNQVMTLNTDGTQLLPAGYSIGVNFTGTMTAAVGCISVTLAPA